MNFHAEITLISSCWQLAVQKMTSYYITHDFHSCYLLLPYCLHWNIVISTSAKLSSMMWSFWNRKTFFFSFKMLRWVVDALVHKHLAKENECLCYSPPYKKKKKQKWKLLRIFSSHVCLNCSMPLNKVKKSLFCEHVSHKLVGKYFDLRSSFKAKKLNILWM